MLVHGILNIFGYHYLWYSSISTAHNSGRVIPARQSALDKLQAAAAQNSIAFLWIMLAVHKGLRVKACICNQNRTKSISSRPRKQRFPAHDTIWGGLCKPGATNPWNLVAPGILRFRWIRCPIFIIAPSRVSNFMSWSTKGTSMYQIKRILCLTIFQCRIITHCTLSPSRQSSARRLARCRELSFSTYQRASKDLSAQSWH